MSDPWWMNVREWSFRISQVIQTASYDVGGGSADFETLTGSARLKAGLISIDTIRIEGDFRVDGRFISNGTYDVEREGLISDGKRCTGSYEGWVGVDIRPLPGGRAQYRLNLSAHGDLHGTFWYIDYDGTKVDSEHLHSSSIRVAERDYPVPATPAQLEQTEAPFPDFPGSRIVHWIVAPSRHIDDAPLAPGQSRLDADMQKVWAGRFPNMDVKNVIVTGPRTNKYNCMALTLDITAKPVWPHDPGSATTLDELMGEYAEQGWVERADGDLIAVYADSQGRVFHVSKVLPDGRHESKFGSDFRMIHRAEDLEGAHMYAGIRLIKFIRGRKQDVPHPTPGPKPPPSKEQVEENDAAAPLHRVQILAQKGGHRIEVDGRRVAGNIEALLAEHMPKREARTLMRELSTAVADAERDARFRRGVWDNPLTKPSRTIDFPVHYTIAVDTSIGHVGAPDWHACKNRKCIENKR